jgi:hypothetical protein
MGAPVSVVSPDRRSRGALGEAPRLEVPARVEDMERF